MDDNNGQQSPEADEFLAAQQSGDEARARAAYAKLSPVDQGRYLHVVPVRDDRPSWDTPRSPREALVAEQAEATRHQERVEARLEALREYDEALALHAAEKFAADLAQLDGRYRPLSTFLTEPDETEPYLIDGLLPYDGNVTLTAPQKTGKTTFVGNLTRSLVDGEPFLGTHTVTERSTVAVWDYEMSERQLREWLRDMHIRNTDRVHLLPLRGLTPSLKHEEFAQWAEEWLRAHGIDVWIIDPGHRAATGFTNRSGDPNDAITEFTQTIDRIKAGAGIRNVCMSLHTGLHGDWARGGARWQDWPDAIWTLSKDKNSGIRTLAARGRDVDVEEQPLRFDPQTRLLSVDQFGKPASLGPSDVQAVAMWLRNHPGEHPSKNVLKHKLGWGSDRADAAWHDAKHAGLITTVPGARGAHELWLVEEQETLLHAQELAAGGVQQAIEVSTPGSSPGEITGQLESE